MTPRPRFLFEEYAGGFRPNASGYCEKARHSDLVSHLARTSMGHLLDPVSMGETDNGDGLYIMPFGLRGPMKSWQLDSQLSRIDGYLKRYPEMTVLLDHSWETGTSRGFEEIEQLLLKKRLPVDRFVLLVSNPRVKEMLKNEKKMQPRWNRTRMRVEGFLSFLLYSSVQFSARYVEADSEDSPNHIRLSKDTLHSEIDRHGNAGRIEAEKIDSASEPSISGPLRPYHFLSMNRRPRPHRILLGLWIHENGLREQGMVSMSSNDYTGDFRNFPSRRQLKKLFAAQHGRVNPDEYLESLPWTIDENMDRSGHTSDWAFRNSPARCYMESYFSLVSESGVTASPENTRITEKTFKPIYNCHPLLLLGSPGALQLLRDYGFNTFRELFDERYDEVADPGIRQKLVHQELRRLCELPRQEIHRKFCNMWPALTENRNRLINHGFESDNLYHSLITVVTSSKG